MTTRIKTEYSNIGAFSSQIESRLNSRSQSTNSFMVKFNEESFIITFNIEELNKLNTFKDAVISAFQMNAQIEEVSLHYQCIIDGFTETEEEALKVSDDSTLCDVLDWHKNNELEVIKFIIKLNISDDKSVLSEDLIEFDEKTARAVLNLSDDAAEKAENAAVQLRLRMNNGILYTEIYDIDECLLSTKFDNEELDGAETPNDEKCNITRTCDILNDEIGAETPIDDIEKYEFEKNELKGPAGIFLSEDVSGEKIHNESQRKASVALSYAPYNDLNELKESLNSIDDGQNEIINIDYASNTKQWNDDIIQKDYTLEVIEQYLKPFEDHNQNNEFIVNNENINDNFEIKTLEKDDTNSAPFMGSSLDATNSAPLYQKDETLEKVKEIIDDKACDTELPTNECRISMKFILSNNILFNMCRKNNDIDVYMYKKMIIHTNQNNKIDIFIYKKMKLNL
eukprot:454907_1